MLASIFDPIHRLLTHPQLAWFLLWIGLASLIVALVVVIRTSWGQSHPLRKCLGLSLLAHLLLFAYATTVHIVTGGGGSHRGGINMMLVDGSDDGSTAGIDNPDAGLDGAQTAPLGVADGSTDPSASSATRSTAQTASDAGEKNLAQPISTAPRAIANLPPLLEVTPPETKPPEHADAVPSTTDIAASADKKTDSAQDKVENPTASSTAIVKPALPEPATTTETSQWVSGPPLPATPIDQNPARMAAADSTAANLAGNQTIGSTATANIPSAAFKGPFVESVAPPIASRGVPEIYADRMARDRTEIARRRGGSPEGESAVQAALEWLAGHQEADGHWDAARYGAMQELSQPPRERQGAGGAGSKADTAVTGLALLAFLGAGNTHLHGDFAPNVQHGLEYLTSAQAADGNLAGSAEVYAFMYSHGIATLALSESYALTGDKRLEPPLRAAINYTIKAQIPITGGWRYRANEPAIELGDTSQLGWQLMSLKSAELAGIDMPLKTRDGIVRFLKSVSFGAHGGMASYQPGVRKPSRTMTAEALVCRQFMGMARDNPASDEAGDYLLTDLPRGERINLYYWYYGTLGMYQLQGEHWRRWNEAMQTTLIGRQRTDGDMAGSWDPECIWGGYGGRIYSTALSSLCLEVYYRYLPIYRVATTPAGTPPATITIKPQ
ncbi:MAG TPA: hypothetical protein VGJ15_04690 [Pirellulales bacterium]